MFINTVQALITGATPSKGTFEKNGEVIKFDNLKFYVQMQLRDGKGFATIENKLKNRSDDFDLIFGGIDLPAMARISYTESTDGKGNMIREYTDIEIIKKQ